MMCIFPIATSKRQLQGFRCFACVSQGLASSLWLLVFSEFLPDKMVSSSSWAGDLKLILRMLYLHAVIVHPNLLRYKHWCRAAEADL